MVNDFAEVDRNEQLLKKVDFWSELLFQSRHDKGRSACQHLPLPVEVEDMDRDGKKF